MAKAERAPAKEAVDPLLALDTFSKASFAIRNLEGQELRSAARQILHLPGVHAEERIDLLSDAELRDFLRQYAKTLREKDPKTLGKVVKILVESARLDSTPA